MARGKPLAKSQSASKIPLHLEIPQKTVGLVYVVGSGDCAQLGLGPDVFEKERPAKIGYFDDLEIVSVVAGGMHTIALSAKGKLYSWGCNDQKALGRSGEESEPAPVEGLDDVTVVSVACGDSISAALTSAGLVYAWGTFRGTNGIFGFAPGIETQPTPYLISELKNIVEISAGTNHLVALAKDGNPNLTSGKIYTWGIGEQNQLGRKVMSRHAFEASLHPRPINFRPYRKTSKFPHVFCGCYHTILVHESNTLFTFGLNNYGQLGLGHLDEMDIPDMVEGIDGSVEIKQAAGGEHFTVILDVEGQVYVCGRNDSGQLGLPASEYPEHCSKATKLDLPKIRSIACGAAFSLAVTEESDLYAWGYGEMGQLANGSEDAPTPFQIDLKGRKVISAAGGGQHTVILVEPKAE
ncbi:Regulator of chromosome condensation [Boothiomyces macroporosus]|uniref:Regulator of chromosome condensation n=1 Tax=Boothiomyces macroporosus TaxID=261099 RepID=A0AAD5Y821_9FUNG|nr:Regulator of chromosome condensation [Boothiomyces macroporosus]